MKLPKKIQISGKTYIVSKNNKSYDSSGRTGDSKITIGTKWKSDEHELDSFLHEVIELVCCERHCHYLAGDDTIVITMNHREFTDVVRDVAIAIRPMIKK